ncbi:MAG: hypothetical protein AB2693_15600, partial [Candidatus Thiodiazotropha sp.]
SLETRSNLHSLPTKFKWDASSIAKFQSALSSPGISTKVDEFRSSPFINDSSGIESALADINSIFLSAASVSLRKVRVRNKPKVRHKNGLTGLCRNSEIRLTVTAVVYRLILLIGSSVITVSKFVRNTISLDRKRGVTTSTTL